MFNFFNFGSGGGKDFAHCEVGGGSGKRESDPDQELFIFFGSSIFSLADEDDLLELFIECGLSFGGHLLVVKF